MANNLIQVKRTSVSGRAANSTTLPNPGELALNMTDGILYSTNGSVVFEIGANNTNAQVSNTLTVKAISANGTLGLNGQVLATNGTSVYWSSAGGGGGTPGGTNTNIQFNSSGLFEGSNAFTFNSSTNTVTISTLAVSTVQANSSSGTSGQILKSNGTTVYWSDAPTLNSSSYATYRYTSSNNQTSFSGLDDHGNSLLYTPGYTLVYLNGVKIIDTEDYTALTGNSVTLVTGTSNNDIVEIVSLETVTVSTDTQVANSITVANTVVISGNSLTTSSNTQQVVDSFSSTVYRSAKYIVQVTDNTSSNFHAQEILVIHNGSAVFMTEYAGVYSNGSSLATFDADISAGAVRLLVTPTVANSTIKASKTLIKI